MKIYEAMLAAGVTPDGRAVERVLLALVQVGRFCGLFCFVWLGGSESCMDGGIFGR